MEYITNFNNNCIERFINSYNERNSNNTIIKHSSIKVCSAKNSYRTLQYQPKGKLVVNSEKGITYEEQIYPEKMHSLIDMSLSADSIYSLVLTPEYSVPMTTIEYLLAKSKDIQVGTLYCLCCQSITVRAMENFMNMLKQTDDVYVWDVAWRSLEKQTLVCPLIYVVKIRFFLKDGSDFDKVFVVPQFKTMPMKDTEMVFETDALSCGDKIIEFGCEDEVRFLSIICADVFNFDLINEIKKGAKLHKTFLFNPQLNKRPQNDYFRFMRNMLINYTQKNCFKVLTLNWSKETKFIMDDGTIIDAVSESWSALYEKFQEGMFDKYMDVLDENALKGMNIIHDHHLMTYFFSSDEHIIDMNIGKFENSLAPIDIQETIPVKVHKVFCYDENNRKFIEAKRKCSQMIDDFFLTEKEFEKLICCESCSGKCSISKINQFVASLYYYGKTKNEFEMINDGKVTSVTSKHYKSEYSRERMYICKRVLRKMKEGLLTKKFLSKNAKFIYRMSDHPAMFNTVFFCEEGEQPCRVVYLKYKTYTEAEAVYNSLSKKYKEQAENFLIYYEDDSGIHLYEKNVNTKIINKSLLNTGIMPRGELNEQ